jgi:hypothetical protein
MEKVLFRKFKRTNEVIAVFLNQNTEEKESPKKMSFMMNDGHSGCDLEALASMTTKCTKDEYYPILEHLNGLGYDVDPIDSSYAYMFNKWVISLN